MKVVHEKPPIYNACVEAFGPLPASVVFAWGDTIYAPSGKTPPPDLVVHESVHSRQQEAAGGAAAWWERYLVDPDFRLAQEVEAYRAQIAAHPDRKARRNCARRVARDLAGPIYGGLVSETQAFALVTGRADLDQVAA